MLTFITFFYFAKKQKRKQKKRGKIRNYLERCPEPLTWSIISIYTVGGAELRDESLLSDTGSAQHFHSKQIDRRLRGFRLAEVDIAATGQGARPRMNGTDWRQTIAARSPTPERVAAVYNPCKLFKSKEIGYNC